MFIDEVTIHVKAGKGGDGAVAFFPMKGGPSGGNGGAGGNIVVRANAYIHNLNKLSSQQGQFVAENGHKGESFNKDGKYGKNLIIEVPLHTELTDIVTKRTVIIDDRNKEYVLCRGGRGGRGNDTYKSATNQTPKYAEKGFPGEEARFRCVLKLIADVGLVGFPNAGKSSLLNELTRAGVKTAPYPFTTLTAHLGNCEGKIIADIPGLIEGAAEGKGLGHRFLKHIEKVGLLLHCISCETKNIYESYTTIRSELERYSPALLQKREIILITKLDLIEPSERDMLIRNLKAQLSAEVMGISIHDVDGINSLKQAIIAA